MDEITVNTISSRITRPMNIYALLNEHGSQQLSLFL